MIAPPLNINYLLDRLGYKEISISQLFKIKPIEIDRFCTDEPWFFFEKGDLIVLENQNQSYKLSDSAKRWNAIKLDIYHSFPKRTRFDDKVATKSDWEYFVYFIKTQNTKKSLRTNYWPRSHDDDAYWINEEYKTLFGDCTICDVFTNAPNTIDRLLVFDKELFFDVEMLDKLLTYNPTYKFSDRSLLWNAEKYNCWIERRKEEAIESRIDWENRIESKKLQEELSSKFFDDDSNARNYFDAMTDGHLGSFEEFNGTDDDIDNWSGK